MARNRISRPQVNKGRLPAPEQVDYDRLPPLFSLERIQDQKHGYVHLSDADKAAFADSIYKRRSLSWRDVTTADRHKLGTERIPKGQIKATTPKFITDDCDYFLALRFNGLKPMVGYRVKNIFYVLWFDTDWSLYDH